MPDDPGRFGGPDRFASRGAASGADDPRLAAALTQLKVIAGALAMSVVIYAVVAWFLTSGAAGTSTEPIGLPVAIVALLGALAVFDLLIAPVVEQFLGAGRQPAAGSGAGAGSEPPDLETALATYRRAKVIGYAFREAAAVFGLLLALFTGNPVWCYALVALTLVAMALAWPSRNGLLRATGRSVQPE